MTERELQAAKIGAIVLGAFSIITLYGFFYSLNMYEAVQGDEKILWFATCVMFGVGYVRNMMAFLRYCKAIKTLDVEVIRWKK